MIRCRVFLVFFAFGFLSACFEKPSPARDAASSVASSGGIHSQAGTVRRIISAAPSYTEIIAGLGLADALIAVDAHSRDVDGVRNDLPEIDFFYPDIEAIVILRPDLIIAGEINTGGSSAAPYEFFERMGVTVIQLPTCNSIGEIYGDIARIAQALGVTERGEELIRRMKEQIETIAVRTGANSAAQGTANGTQSAASETQSTASGTQSTANGGKSVYFEIAPAPNIVSFGGGTYLDEMISIAGGQNIFAAEKRWFTPGPEAIISANPDVIFFLADENAGTTATAAAAAVAAATAVAEIKSRPGFNTLSAVRQNRVYPINANRASRPSQNIVLALEEMYRALNHDLAP